MLACLCAHTNYKFHVHQRQAQIEIQHYPDDINLTLT